MKQIKMLALAVGCIALLCSVASTAAAQAPLDNTWFQIDASIKAELLTPANGSVTKENLKRTAYLFVAENGGGYGWWLFSETSLGVWNSISSGSIPSLFITDAGIFTQLCTWQIATPGPTQVVLYLHGKFTPNLNKDGSLKKAGFSVLGATIINTFSPAGEIIFGTAKIKAKMIDEADLPPGVPLP